MATIHFLADTGAVEIQNLSGSGLGFFGPGGFGTSVAVNSYQDSTVITDGNGLTNGGSVDNIKWIHPNSGLVNGANQLALDYIANRNATLNIRFTHTSVVKTQNVKLRIFDRSNINNNASGVLTKVAILRHPATDEGTAGSGDTAWQTPGGSSVVVTLGPSPGASGLWDNGTSTKEDAQHDWYVAISASPSSIGSKTQYGLYVELEYL